jgi:calreticulin
MNLNLAIFFGLVAFCASHVYFQDDFSNADWQSRWVVSDWKRDSGEAGDWGLSAGKYHTDESKERGLKTLQDARFYDISAAHEEFSNKGKTLVIQFSVKHEQNIDCGGGYVKLVGANNLSDQKNFQGGASETVYNVMFGPDICGYTKKVHFILHKGGKNHLIKDDISAESDEFTHVYTAVLNSDNTFRVLVDGSEKKSGTIPDHWDILPPKKINDPNESKPADWVDERLIDDPEDKKPEGWDDIPAEIVDPDAKKPEDWDDDLDGEWEAPKVANPEYKGPWSPKKIDNPAYKGPWVHPQIDNPDYKDDPELYAFDSFKYLGIDVWQVKSGSIFGHFLLTDDFETAQTQIDAINAIREGEKKKKEEADAAAKAAADAAAEADDDDDDDDDVEDKPQTETPETPEPPKEEEKPDL